MPIEKPKIEAIRKIIKELEAFEPPLLGAPHIIQQLEQEITDQIAQTLD